MSYWTTTKRIARYGLVGFVRNGFVSLSAILMMTIMSFMLVNIMISNAAMTATLKDLTNKVDVTVYFRTNATGDQIEQINRSLQSLPEVASVSLMTREQALADFRERHKNDQLTIQALDELGTNPLGASLEIRAKQTSQYEGIAKYLQAQQDSQSGAGVAIDKVNFYQNKTAIDRLTNIIDTSKKNGIAKTIFLAVCAVLIVLNTIRLAIYTARDEIGVMNLVGASRWYVRGPFMVAGVLYGVVSSVLVLILLYPILLYHPVLIGLDPTTELLFGNFNSFTYYTANFLLFFVVVTGTSIALGALSSYLAVRRYLRT
ncbi:ABC transporter permease [Candidatus Kaiserbacteria bacterium]|nr:ABC transporter permease [Candidatus Kaiserbacteria bacterium]